MNDVLTTLKAFVAGDMTPQAFRERLLADPAGFEAVLNNDPSLPEEHFVRRYGGLYQWMMKESQRIDKPAGALNVHAEAWKFLHRNGIEYTKTTKYDELFALILDGQPSWLDVDDRYVQEQMLPAAGDLKGKARLKWLREEFKKRFRYLDKKPQWIQAPAWPIGPNGPLLFIGQLKLNQGAVFVFQDEVSGKFENVVQRY